MGFVWAGVNKVIRLACSPRQLHQDPFEEVFLVRFQINSGMVCLWWERDPTSIWPNYQVYIASMSWTTPIARAALHSEMWQSMQTIAACLVVLAPSWRMNQGLTRTSDEAAHLLDKVWSSIAFSRSFLKVYLAFCCYSFAWYVAQIRNVAFSKSRDLFSLKHSHY